jgi:hypothetical protein
MSHLELDITTTPGHKEQDHTDNENRRAGRKEPGGLGAGYR